MQTIKETQNWKIASEIELIYKTRVRASERPQIKSSRSTYELAMRTWDLGKIDFFEQFKVFLLDRSNKVLGIYEVSSGGTTGAFVDLRLLFSAALKANAKALIVIHNHPSGKTLPSVADRLITQKIKEAGIILDIVLIDHLIISSEDYYSFADSSSL
ncbi:JAB domain-containing protein [Flavobacterium lipolyticum]|uniref:JAB domain-containing protein n=1 Tax=Flavobacterium lipolyticum TaxID=2893754 RepID=A0ABS8M0V5_9FLAO|nr:JAB domain-containing protein [Flavobacterium sp. F-126]MCC9018461.1 JAB domain-containing protein [Flavobacterium sp. F-126]